MGFNDDFSFFFLYFTSTTEPHTRSDTTGVKGIAWKVLL